MLLTVVLCAWSFPRLIAIIEIIIIRLVQTMQYLVPAIFAAQAREPFQPNLIICIQFKISQQFYQPVMSRLRKGFYEPSSRQLQDGKINDILGMINKQQQSITDLLNKYHDSKPYQSTEDSPFIQKSKTIDSSAASKKANIKSLRNKRSLTKLSKYVELPEINQIRYLDEKQRKRKTNSSANKETLIINSNTQKHKKNLKFELEKIYNGNQQRSKRHSNHVKRRLNSSSQYVDSQQQKQAINSSEQLRNKEGQQFEYSDMGIPQPLAYYIKGQHEDSDSSSEEGEVPLTYYEKQYRQALKVQCLEEINFLYFSKNESMREWTDGVLSLFQRHDKQLVGIRKKCKYLQKFDGNYFSIDIFRES